MSVDITFRTDGAWGSGQGFNLSPAQVDDNFYALQVAVEYIQDNPVQPYQINNVTQSGSELTFWLSNGDNFTVTLPIVSYTGAPIGTDIDPTATTDPVYTVAVDDLGKWFTVINGDVAIILDDVDPAAPVRSEIHFDSDPDTGGVVTIESSSDVVVKVKPGFLAAVDTGGVMTVKKLAEGVWRVFGDLLADEST